MVRAKSTNAFSLTSSTSLKWTEERKKHEGRREGEREKEKERKRGRQRQRDRARESMCGMMNGNSGEQNQ